MGNWMPGFIIHATRGLVREQTMRRKVMFTLLVLAALILVSGSTFLQELLDHHAHPVWFIVYWLVCAWLTATALLLALFDLLLLRAQSRAARKALRREWKQ